MKISDYKNFIKEFPYQNHAFDIKRSIWKIDNHIDYLDELFGTSEVITINRQDLVNSASSMKEFIFKTLMWGYPTKGRGTNIETMLENENLNILIDILEGYRNTDISIETLKNDIKAISKLGLSTMSKFTQFLNTTINSNTAVILDMQIIGAINTGRFEELNPLVGISYDNAINKYEQYIDIIEDLSSSMNIESQKIEMFLFMFGNVLNETK
jgi:hypothetical protein